MTSRRLCRTGLLAALCAVSAVYALAQEEESNLNPIQWSLKAKLPAAPIKAGDRLTAELTAQIDKGWHLYSTEQVEGGPKPTRVTVPEGQPFEQAGEIETPAPRSSYDPNFQVTTEFYEESVIFTIPVRLLPSAAAGDSKLVVQVRYQTCTQTLCLPPKLLKFEAPVQVAGVRFGAPQPQADWTVAGEHAAEGLAVGAPVPDFEFVDFSGKARHFSEYRGRYVLIDFWATWCSPCLADIPRLKELYLKYHARGFEIIGMNSETLGQDQARPDPESAKEAQAHAREIVTTRGVIWTQAANETAVPLAVKVFGVESLPAKILIDSQGRLVARIKETSGLDELLSRLLSEKQ